MSEQRFDLVSMKKSFGGAEGGTSSTNRRAPRALGRFDCAARPDPMSAVEVNAVEVEAKLVAVEVEVEHDPNTTKGGAIDVVKHSALEAAHAVAHAAQEAAHAAREGVQTVAHAPQKMQRKLRSTDTIHWEQSLRRDEHSLQRAKSRSSIFKATQRYSHDKHGEGTVTSLVDGGVTIKFDNGESHTYDMLSQRKLKPVIQDAHGSTPKTLFEMMDLDSSGYLDLDEFEHIHRAIVKGEREHAEKVAELIRSEAAQRNAARKLRRIVIGALVFILILLAGVAGLLVVVVDAYKDTAVSQSGALVMKGSDAPITVENPGFHVGPPASNETISMFVDAAGNVVRSAPLTSSRHELTDADGAVVKTAPLTGNHGELTNDRGQPVSVAPMVAVDHALSSAPRASSLKDAEGNDVQTERAVHVTSVRNSSGMTRLVSMLLDTTEWQKSLESLELMTAGKTMLQVGIEFIEKKSVALPLRAVADGTTTLTVPPGVVARTVCERGVRADKAVRAALRAAGIAVSGTATSVGSSEGGAGEGGGSTGGTNPTAEEVRAMFEASPNATNASRVLSCDEQARLAPMSEYDFNVLFDVMLIGLKHPRWTAVAITRVSATSARLAGALESLPAGYKDGKLTLLNASEYLRFSEMMSKDVIGLADDDLWPFTSGWVPPWASARSAALSSPGRRLGFGWSDVSDAVSGSAVGQFVGRSIAALGNFASCNAGDLDCLGEALTDALDMQAFIIESLFDLATDHVKFVENAVDAVEKFGKMVIDNARDFGDRCEARTLVAPHASAKRI